MTPFGICSGRGPCDRLGVPLFSLGNNARSGEMMHHTKSGRTGLRVSKLCLGTMTFGLQCDVAQSNAIMDAAATGGIDFLDAADVYPLGGGHNTAGRTEQIVGAWLKGKGPQFLLATKCVGQMGPKPWDLGMSRKHILDAIDASLRRLS